MLLLFSVASFACSAASYTPGRVTGVKVVYKSNRSVKLKWSSVKNATGYRVYRYIDSQKKYVALETVKGSTSKLISGLKSATAYKFAVRAYRKISGSTYYGSYSDNLKLTTLELKSSDISKLEGMLSSMEVIQILWGEEKVLTYDSSKSSFKKVLNLMGGCPFYYGLGSVFYALGWDKYFTVEYLHPDPLRIISDDESYDGYYKVKASKFDWIVKNVFNKTPRRNIEDYGCDNSYYYNGYYYFPTFDSGELYPDIKIVDRSLSSSGMYTISFCIEDYDLGEFSDIHTMTARLKSVGGKRTWSIYTIRK